MSTKTLVDRIKPFAKGWSRTGDRGILNLIQEGQDELMNYDAPWMRYVDTGNKGFPPFLKTTTGTYRYSINSTNLDVTALAVTIGGTARTVRCKRVMAIFVDVNKNFDYGRTWVGETYAVGFGNPYRNSNDRVEFAKIPIRAYPCLETTEASIDFLEDPGTTTNIYFCDFVWEPQRLTAETIPLCVPQAFESALEDYVIGKIEQFANGKYNERLIRFQEYWIKRYNSEMSMGTQVESLDVIPE